MINDLIFYGETSMKIKALKDESGIFERNLDVYLAAGVVGAIYNKKGPMLKSDSEKNNVSKTTINASQLLGAESTRIKFLTSLIFMIESYDKNYDENELLKLAFSDWFNTTNNEKISEDKDKYKLFNEYVVGGVNILYDKIISTSNNPDNYLRNYYKFIEEINKLQLNSPRDRIFAEIEI